MAEYGKIYHVCDGKCSTGMAKGTVEIDGVQYTFSWETGVLQQ